MLESPDCDAGSVELEALDEVSVASHNLARHVLTHTYLLDFCFYGVSGVYVGGC
jgi:hypothetical protein